MTDVHKPDAPPPREDDNGVDIEQIRSMLSMSPEQRLQTLERMQRLILEARRAAQST